MLYNVVLVSAIEQSESAIHISTSTPTDSGTWWATVHGVTKGRT